MLRMCKYKGFRWGVGNWKIENSRRLKNTRLTFFVANARPQHQAIGEQFNAWQDQVRERVCRASPFPTKAFAFVLRVEHP